MTIEELESLKEDYLNMVAELVLGEKNDYMCPKVTTTINKLDELIDEMPVDKSETEYVSIYLAYEFYRIKVEYFS